ncbi:transposase family protein [Streptomyces vinaceus]
MDRLAVLPGPRRRLGARHPFVAVALVAACAVAAVARSWAAIGQWSGAAPRDTPARRSHRPGHFGCVPRRRSPPSAGS